MTDEAPQHDDHCWILVRGQWRLIVRVRTDRTLMVFGASGYGRLDLSQVRWDEYIEDLYGVWDAEHPGWRE